MFRDDIERTIGSFAPTTLEELEKPYYYEQKDSTLPA